MRTVITMALISFSTILRGQVSPISDTVRIKEIFVKGDAVSSVINGYKNSKVDTSVISDHSLDNLSDIISEGTPLFVKNYGPAGVATLSFRGMGPSHTQLTWNELNINSPMLGQADLSLIPGGFADEIRVFSGGASVAAGSGGLGGLLSMETKPDWKNNKSFLLNVGAGSFGRYSGLIKFRTGSEKFQSVTRAYTNTAVNDFPFMNSASYSEPVTEYRKNSEVFQSSLMQEFYIRGKKSVTTASTWYSYMDRNLPSNILVPQESGSESQVDHSLRTVISHNRYLNKGGFQTTLAWFNEYLRYINKTTSTDSRNISNTLYLKEVLQIPAGNKLDLKVMLLDEVNMVNTINYNGLKSRNLLTMSASARKEIGERLGVVVLFRELINGNKFISPDYSAAIDFELVKNSGSFLKMNFSKNSKVPTMNDLFWNPGGNHNLTNEYSYNGEVSLELRKNASEYSHFNSDLTLYSGRIKDMIQWRPGSFSYWSPVNVASVGASGIETGFGYNYARNKTVVKINILYSFNRSKSLDNVEEANKQLIYVPVNMLNNSIRVAFGNFSGGLTACYTGKRYTTTDNSEFLPGFMLFDLNAGYSLSLHRNFLDLTLRTENIFDKQYEVIAWYPMPRRSFLFSLTWRFNKK